MEYTSTKSDILIQAYSKHVDVDKCRACEGYKLNCRRHINNAKDWRNFWTGAAKREGKEGGE